MAIGTAAAALQLAGLALRTARLIQTLTEAPKEARLLIHKTRHLCTLAKNVATVLESREQARDTSTRSTAENAVLESLGNSMEECTKYLRLIRTKLQRFETAGRNKKSQRVVDSVHFLFSKSSITAQEKVVEVHLQTFSISLNLLHELDRQERYVQQVVGLGQSLRNRAADRRTSFGSHPEINALGPIELPDEGDSSDSGIYLGTGIQEEPRDDSDDDLDLHQGCSRCRDANFTVPDTPLSIAVKRDEVARVKGLIEAGANVLFKDVDQWTLLHHAADRFNYESLIILIESQYGRDHQFINAQTMQGYTALMLIARQADNNDSFRLATALLENQCDVNLEDAKETQRTALYFTVDAPYSQSRDKFVGLLVKYGASLGLVYEKIPERFKQFPALHDYKPGPMNRRSSDGSSMVERIRSRIGSQADNAETEQR